MRLFHHDHHDVIDDHADDADDGGDDGGVGDYDGSGDDDDDAEDVTCRQHVETQYQSTGDKIELLESQVSHTLTQDLTYVNDIIMCHADAIFVTSITRGQYACVKGSAHI